jgi:hypothetical protein
LRHEPRRGDRIPLLNKAVATTNGTDHTNTMGLGSGSPRTCEERAGAGWRPPFHAGTFVESLRFVVKPTAAPTLIGSHRPSSAWLGRAPIQPQRGVLRQPGASPREYGPEMNTSPERAAARGNSGSPVELTFEGECKVADGHVDGSPFEPTRRGFNLERAVGTTDRRHDTDGGDLPHTCKMSRLPRGEPPFQPRTLVNSVESLIEATAAFGSSAPG